MTTRLEQILGSSSAAQAWIVSTEKLASELVSAINTRNGVIALFNVLHTTLTRSLNEVATAWNDSHDRLRFLPLELKEQCLSRLTLTMKCRLALVCRHWRDSIVSIPALWTDIDLWRCHGRADLDALLTRSGNLFFALDVSVRADRTLSYIDECLQAHAHRLRKLGLVVERTNSASGAILRYPAPVLEELSLTYNGGRDTWDVEDPALIFQGCAPKLRTVRLDQVTVPPVCPAFAHVTAAAIHHCAGGLSNVHSVMPSLQTLEFYFPEGPIPYVPATASLRLLRLCEVERMTCEELRLAAARVFSFVMDVPYDKQQLINALALDGHGTPSLELTLDGSLQLDFQNDARTRQFFFFNANLEDVQRLFHASDVFHGIQRLVLPSSVVFAVPSARRPLPAHLPRLRTLGVRKGGGSPRTMVSYIGPLEGPLRAPALARIELLADDLDARVNCVRPVNAVHLVSLIEHTLAISDRANLDLFIDTARGVRLVGDVDRLRACVGRLLV